MATINTAHHESGGVILFNGELILLFCENVNLSIVEKNESESGKLYLTTHRMIFTNSSMRNNLKSFSIPFYTMHDLSLEQPIFGANYIKGKATEPTNSKLTFKLKFNSGGATEYGQALLNATKTVRTNAPSFQPAAPYNPNPASQYYQAPPNIYQPAYNCGFALPNDKFNQPPPAGFIYTSDAPPPYPGLNKPQGPQPGAGYPPAAQQQPGYGPPSGYPSGAPQQAGGIFGMQPPGGHPPQQPGSGYPPQQPGSGYPPQQPSGGYPPHQSSGGYPPQPSYPGAQPNGYPSQYPGMTSAQSQQSGTPSLYPDLKDMPANPSAPPL